MWFGVTLGSFIWVAASLVMSLWTLWFGLGLARTKIGLRPHNGGGNRASSGSVASDPLADRGGGGMDRFTPLKLPRRANC